MKVLVTPAAALSPFFWKWVGELFRGESRWNLAAAALDTETPTAVGTEWALTGQRSDGVWLFVQQFVQMGLFTLCRIPLWTQAAAVAPRGAAFGVQCHYWPWQADRWVRKTGVLF